MPRGLPTRAIARLGLALMLIVAAAVSPALAQKRPNILVILVDDMGFSDTSPYGAEVHTPNIAQLANQGMMLTNFHASAYCAPTRGMLLTGVDNHLIGMGNMAELRSPNQVGKPGYEGYLNGRAPTIATRLRQSGYHTYMAGKWHLGKTPATIPAAQGFEQSVGVLEGGADNFEIKSYTPTYKKVNFFEKRGEMTMPGDFYSTKYYTDRMIGYIDANRKDGKPFFGYLAYQAVHQPHQAPQEFIDRYMAIYQVGWYAIREHRYMRQVESGVMPAGLPMPRPPFIPQWDSLSPEEQRTNAKRMAVYAGMVEYMDMSIGRLTDYLRRNGMLDNTVVVLLSDNGAEAAALMPIFPDYYAANFDLTHARMGLKGSYSEYGPGWAMTSGTPFTNFKGSASEGGLRAQFIVRHPGLVARGARSSAFTHVLDVAPTPLRYAGIQGNAPGAAPMTGRDMGPLLSGATRAIYPANQAVGYEVAGSSALFQGDYKLQRNAPPYGDMVWRLYDIAKDPTEQRDIGAQMPDRKAAMIAAYQAYVARNGVVEVPADYDVVKQGRANTEQANH